MARASASRPDRDRYCARSRLTASGEEACWAASSSRSAPARSPCTSRSFDQCARIRSVRGARRSASTKAASDSAVCPCCIRLSARFASGATFGPPSSARVGNAIRRRASHSTRTGACQTGRAGRHCRGGRQWRGARASASACPPWPASRVIRSMKAQSARRSLAMMSVSAFAAPATSPRAIASRTPAAVVQSPGTSFCAPSGKLR